MSPVDANKYPSWLVDEINKSYNEQKEQSQFYPYTIIPINFSNAHWALMFIHYIDDTSYEVYLFDSLGIADNKKTILSNIILKTEYHNASIINLSPNKIQEDGYTCGTWMLRGIRAIIIGLINRDIYETAADAINESLYLASQDDISQEHAQTLANISNIQAKNSDKNHQQSLQKIPSTKAPAIPYNHTEVGDGATNIQDVQNSKFNSDNNIFKDCTFFANDPQQNNKTISFGESPTVASYVFSGAEDDIRNEMEHIKSNTKSKRKYITGMSGIGKTTLAAHLFQTTDLPYKGKLWFTAEKKEDLLNQYSEFADNHSNIKLTEGGNVAKKVKSWLEGNPGWLIVYDNVESISSIDEFIPAMGAFVFITQQNPAAPDKFLLSPGNFKESGYKIIKKYAESFSNDMSEYLDKDYQAIAEKIDYLPLAMAQIGAYIGEFELSPVGFLQDYESNDKVTKEIYEFDELEKAHVPVYRTWDMIFSKLRDNNPRALELIDQISYMYPDNIPRTIFSGNNKEVIVLKKRALITLGERYFSIHRVLSQVIRLKHQSLGMEEQGKHIRTALRSILSQEESFKKFHSHLKTTDKDFNDLIPHCKRIIKNIDKHEGIIAGEEVAYIKYQMGKFAGSREYDYEAAASYLVHPYEFIERELAFHGSTIQKKQVAKLYIKARIKSDATFQACCANSIAEFYRDMKEDKITDSDAVEILLELAMLLPDHLKYFVATNFEIQEGEAGSKATLLVHNLKENSDIKTKNIKYIYDYYYVRARYYFYEKEYDSAIEYLKKGEALPFQNSGSLTKGYHLMSIIYYKIEDYKEAIKYMEKVINLQPWLKSTSAIEKEKKRLYNYYLHIVIYYTHLLDKTSALDYLKRIPDEMVLKLNICNESGESIKKKVEELQ